jgi:large subunit ribosomal protein L4
MTSTQVLDLKGKKVGELELEASVFASELKTGPMHQALIRQLANARAGSANTKTRAEVRGGGRKPWRQKGTGRARAGSIRSPLWHGGGVVFGPKPRDYSVSMPQKMRHVAVRSALAVAKDKLVVVKDFAGLSAPKTKEFAQVLKALNIESGKKVLVVLADLKEGAGAMVYRAARNIDKLKVIAAHHVNVKDLLHFDVILTSEDAIELLNKTFKHSPSPNAPKKEPKEKASKKKEAKKPAKKAKEAKPKEKKEPKAKVAKEAKSEKAKEEKPKAKKEDAPKKEKADKEKKSAAKDKDAKPKKKDT